jgi:hypothetical protein
MPVPDRLVVPVAPSPSPCLDTSRLLSALLEVAARGDTPHVALTGPGTPVCRGEGPAPGRPLSTVGSSSGASLCSRPLVRRDCALKIVHRNQGFRASPHTFANLCGREQTPPSGCAVKYMQHPKSSSLGRHDAMPVTQGRKQTRTPCSSRKVLMQTSPGVVTGSCDFQRVLTRALGSAGPHWFLPGKCVGSDASSVGPSPGQLSALARPACGDQSLNQFEECHKRARATLHGVTQGSVFRKRGKAARLL